MDHWVIYDHPADYPDSWVVRRWRVTGDRGVEGGIEATGDVWLSPSLRGARAAIPEGLVCITRHPDDDPKIVEVWL